MAVMNTLLFIKMKKPPVHQQETLFKQLHQQSYFRYFRLLSLRELVSCMMTAMITAILVEYCTILKTSKL